MLIFLHSPSISHPEHFCHSYGEYGSLHAKSLQQQNLVSALPQYHYEVFIYDTCLIRICIFSLYFTRFVIELCEPIQVKQLDIANFELFSSTPKDFLVSISDRYILFVACMCTRSLIEWQWNSDIRVGITEGLMLHT